MIRYDLKEIIFDFAIQRDGFSREKNLKFLHVQITCHVLANMTSPYRISLRLLAEEQPCWIEIVFIPSNLWT